VTAICTIASDPGLYFRLGFYFSFSKLHPHYSELKATRDSLFRRNEWNIIQSATVIRLPG